MRHARSASPAAPFNPVTLAGTGDRFLRVERRRGLREPTFGRDRNRRCLETGATMPRSPGACWQAGAVESASLLLSPSGSRLQLQDQPAPLEPPKQAIGSCLPKLRRLQDWSSRCGRLLPAEAGCPAALLPNQVAFSLSSARRGCFCDHELDQQSLKRSDDSSVIGQGRDAGPSRSAPASREQGATTEASSRSTFLAERLSGVPVVELFCCHPPACAR